ncbi:uncharacterized protein LOC108844678 [Raphanus sativus]|uniref:Uncharacterized protein LOC108844678 n=1 Tax=Raphanus sativus TaxID=3726 RepID=A0A6J0MSB7_RAPSA|nr:uncharacterized protein LOC108844678 [Raphanus sativus]XP_056853376.1 uncharacterized protein LOC108844678 [Raphanus sativus]
MHLQRSPPRFQYSGNQQRRHIVTEAASSSEQVHQFREKPELWIRYMSNLNEIELQTFPNEVVLREYVFVSPLKHRVLACFAASVAAMNFASHEESSTVGCLDDIYVIGDVPR